MRRFQFESFEQLESFLRDWRSFADADVYDFVGMATLMAACLDNLSAHALESELAEVGDCFTERQKAFLKRLADSL